MYEQLYKQIEEHVTALFENTEHSNLLYHNLDHTKNVVARALEIAAHYQLSDEDMFILYAAAWFHDSGHLFTDLAKHEEKSVELMQEFMQNEPVKPHLVKNIAECILATHFPPSPSNRLQEIICDADTYHFGTKEFKKTNKLVKQELTQRNYTAMVADWNTNTLHMLEAHKYFTPYCHVLLDEGKKENIERIKRKQHKQTPDNSYTKLFEDEKKPSKQEKRKNSMVEKGVQTMLRLTSSNHLKLSEMADRKAHILISVNAIVISITLTVFIKSGVSSDASLYPAIVFLISSLTTIIVSILATRPTVTEGVFRKEDVMTKQINLLFFGNFYKSTLEEYQWAMSTIMKDHDYLYGVLIQDIHQLGKVLAKKYKLIRLAYNIFMIGLVISVLTFIVAGLIYNSQTEPSVIINSTGSPL